MTKNEAIENHRKLWTWLAEENKRRINTNEKPANKPDYFDAQGIPPSERPAHDCYVCQYALDSARQASPEYPKEDLEWRKCEYCPLDWTNNGEFDDTDCESEYNTGLFDEFWYAVKSEDATKCAETAETIANLPAIEHMTLKIPELEKYNQLMSLTEPDYDEHNLKQYSVIASWTADFGEGIQVDVKVCTSENRTPLWCEAVLFNNGNEVACSEVMDELDRDWTFEYNGTVYVVTVTDGK